MKDLSKDTLILTKISPLFMRTYKNQGLPNCTKGSYMGHSFTAHKDTEPQSDEFYCDNIDSSFGIKYFNGESEDSIQNIRYTHCIYCGYQFQDITYQEDGITRYSDKILSKKDRIKDNRLDDYSKEDIDKDRENLIEGFYKTHGKEKVESGFYNA